jgi:hypothetical protein
LLQGAVTTPLWIEVKNQTITVPMIKTLEMGYSGLFV